MLDSLGRENLLYAIPTMHCNLNCNHCFIRNRPETFDRDKFLHILNSFEGEIILFGGEVTSHRERMMDVVNNNLENGKSKIGYVSTNLIVLDDQILEFYQRIGHISTSWNPSRFNDKEYEIWKKNCKILGENGVTFRVMVTLTDDLFQIPMNKFMSLVHEWVQPGLYDIKFEHYVGKEVTPEYFDRADDWLCSLYLAWDIPIKLELLGRLGCWRYDCDHIYTMFPDGSVVHACPHNGKGHVPLECYSCEKVEKCRPCKLQPYCSYPKKLEKLVAEQEAMKNEKRVENN